MIKEPSLPSSNELTSEKYQEIKANLESENLESFPSLFQQARNLVKQAWVSGIDAAKGRPLLATAEKAAARIAICATCEFFKENRCLKCGCYMDKKVHVESASCPTNKWGADLQKMLPSDIAEINKKAPSASIPEINLSDFSEQDATQIEYLATRSLEYDGRFTHKGLQYKAFLDASGKRVISRLAYKPRPIEQALGFGVVDPEKENRFKELVLKHQKEGEPKVFVFENMYFGLTPRTPEQGGGFTMYKIDPANPPAGITLPPLNN